MHEMRSLAWWTRRVRKWRPTGCRLLPECYGKSLSGGKRPARGRVTGELEQRGFNCADRLHQKPMPIHRAVLAGQRWCAMNAAEGVIRWSTGLAVVGVATVAAVVSYEHAGQHTGRRGLVAPGMAVGIESAYGMVAGRPVGPGRWGLRRVVESPLPDQAAGLLMETPDSARPQRIHNRGADQAGYRRNSCRCCCCWR